MKKLSSLFAWALFSGCASASPFVVYSGTITGDNLSSAGATKGNTLIFVATDIADTSNFSVLLVDSASKTYSVIARPSDSPASDEASNNFFGSVGDGAVLSYSIETTDSSNNSTVVRAYATGPLTTKNTMLVAARNSYVVHLKTNRVAQGTYTFSTATAAISSGANPFPVTLAGASHGYVIDSAGALTHATTPGVLTLRENPLLTTDANIGGGYPVSLSTEIAVLPISIANGQSESDAMAAWLSAFAQANGYVVPATTNAAADAGITLYTGGTALGGDSLALSGSYSGSSLVTVGAGTLVLNGANVYTAGNPAILSTSATSPGNSVLTLGGLGSSSSGTITPTTFTLNSGGTVTSGSSAATLTLNIASDLTIGTGGGTLGGGGGPGQGTLSNISINSGTVTISAINGSVVSGTIISAPSNTTFTFTGSAFDLNGTTGVSGLGVGQTLTGSITLSGGTTGNTALDYVGGTLTITTP